MKRFLLIIVLFCSVSMYAVVPDLFRLDFSVGYVVKPWPRPFPKSPVLPPEAPEATLENNVLTFTSTHDDYTLTLLDEHGEVAYQVVVPSTVNIVVLPTTLSGEFELQLSSGDNYYFYCDIEL